MKILIILSVIGLLLGGCDKREIQRVKVQESKSPVYIQNGYAVTEICYKNIVYLLHGQSITAKFIQAVPVIGSAPVVETC